MAGFEYRPPSGHTSALDAFGWQVVAEQWQRAARHAQPERYQHVYDRYPETLRDNRAGAGNLILVGPQGNGKTTMALAAVRPSLEAPAERRHVVRVWRFADLVMQIGEFETEAEIEAKQAGVLVLDDLAVNLEDMVPAKSEAVLRIVDTRAARLDLPIVATADTDRVPLMKMLGYRGKAIVSRLWEGAHVRVVTGEDLRGAADHRTV